MEAGESEEFQVSRRVRPAIQAAKAAAICASGRLFMIKGDVRQLYRITRALARYADVEVDVFPHWQLLMAWPAGRGDEMLPVGVRV